MSFPGFGIADRRLSSPRDWRAKNIVADKRIFLGVKRSATGLCWEHRLTERQEMIALTIAQSHGVPDIVARVLAGRGVTPEETERFLDPTIKNLLPDPASLTDMDRAAERLAQAIRNREKVAIFGDYDVDGAASSALLEAVSRLLRRRGRDLHPRPYLRGLRPEPEAMRELAGRGATLIVTVDCGTNSAPLDRRGLAGRRGGRSCSTIIRSAAPLPVAVAVVNPNREDDLSGQGHLCAAGVVFLALVQTARLLRIERPDAPQPDLLVACSIWSRWRRSATWFRSPASTAPMW